MSIDGSWTITVTSPMGPQVSTLVLKAEGGSLVGTQSQDGLVNTITAGKFADNVATWSNAVIKPVKMNLDFTAKLVGDTLNGSVKAGVFGKFPFTGVRA